MTQPPNLREALGKAVRFCAFDSAEPNVIAFEFANDEDRLAAANAVDQFFLFGGNDVALATPPQVDANHSSAPDAAGSPAAFNRAAEIALTFRPRGENAKHFVDVLVCDIAAAIRQEGQDA